ncbi:MAG: DUF2156 domain-containing protein [Clostridia bacterium]|nr:DUF2156 domain-containing protein [Deltaproteobacteria bacterium]
MSLGKADTVATRARAPGMGWWHGGAGYCDTGSAWVAAGRPACDGFVLAAAAAGRRAVLFGVEAPVAGMKLLHIGEQPYFERTAWRGHKGLRDQVRRAHRKGAVTRVVRAKELEVGTPLRTQVDALTRAWLAARRMEPMKFVVEVDPVRSWDPQLQIAAVHEGDLVGFVSAVRVPRTSTWLVEHLLRSPTAPNGVAEMLLDAVFDELEDSENLTLGLAPLCGTACWQRTFRWAVRPLYDFDGLFRFKQRLHPSIWRPVWIAYPPKQSPIGAIADCLRAFAGESLMRFGLRTLWRRPGAAAFAMAVPLVPWTLGLFGLAAMHRAGPLGFSGDLLWGWALFDAVLIAGMFRAAATPTRRLLSLLWVAALIDAALSTTHVLEVGLGSGLLGPPLRLLAALAPIIASVLLGRSVSSRWQNMTR